MQADKLRELPHPKYLARLSSDGEWAELVPANDWTAEMWFHATDPVYTADQMHAYAAAAIAEASEGLRADAMRYRWLRLQVVRFNLSPKLNAYDLDAAIDAALSGAVTQGESHG